MIVRALQGDSVDAIVWRAFGRTAGLVEQVFALNPGLAELGAIVPEGTEIVLPDPAETEQPTARLVQLWD